jgi:hypothetical protein
MKRYFYALFGAGGIQVGKFLRCDVHPFHPDLMQKLMTDVAHGLSMAQRILVRPEHVTILSVTELEPEVAAARWPKDFETAEQP